MKGAACAGSDPNRWHPDEYTLTPKGYAAAVEAAKAICRTCPVRPACLDLALSMGIEAKGIMGATTLDERRAMVSMPAAQVIQRQARAEAARTMHAEGLEVRVIAGQLGVGPKSVMRYLRVEQTAVAS